MAKKKEAEAAAPGKTTAQAAPKPAAPAKEKTLDNTTASKAKTKIKDLKIWGDGDAWKLICKASTESEGWMKSTKAMQIGKGVAIQVTTQQRNPDGSYAIAESVTTKDNSRIVEVRNKKGILTGRQIVAFK